MIMNIDIVGYTGFVGSNLCLSHKFDHYYNSKNISDAYGTAPDILVYAGVTGTKYIANKNPEKDKQIIESAISNIEKIAPKKLVLISTIDTFVKPDNINEDEEPTSQSDFVYGFHRRILEEWVKKNVENYLIVRLPGIYGANLKKNYIYDLINPIPQVLSQSLYESFSSKEEIIKKIYKSSEDGFYHIINNNNFPKSEILAAFARNNFSALNFTDSRGFFQYYNLKFLWRHIQIALRHNLKILNIATEPFTISELYTYVSGKTMKNECSRDIPFYNLKTKYDVLFGGANNYMFTKKQVMQDIKSFIEEKNEIS